MANYTLAQGGVSGAIEYAGPDIPPFTHACYMSKSTGIDYGPHGDKLPDYVKAAIEARFTALFSVPIEERKILCGESWVRHFE